MLHVKSPFWWCSPGVDNYHVINTRCIIFSSTRDCDWLLLLRLVVPLAFAVEPESVSGGLDSKASWANLGCEISSNTVWAQALRFPLLSFLKRLTTNTRNCHRTKPFTLRCLMEQKKNDSVCVVVWPVLLASGRPALGERWSVWMCVCECVHAWGQGQEMDIRTRTCPFHNVLPAGLFAGRKVNAANGLSVNGVIKTGLQEDKGNVCNVCDPE